MRALFLESFGLFLLETMNLRLSSINSTHLQYIGPVLFGKAMVERMLKKQRHCFCLMLRVTLFSTKHCLLIEKISLNYSQKRFTHC